MSDKPQINPEVVEQAKTKLNSYQEILKIKPKKQRHSPAIEKLKKMLTQRQFDMLKIKTLG